MKPPKPFPLLFPDVQTKVYVAGAFTDKDRLKREADRLEALGYVIVSSWLTSSMHIDLPPSSSQYVDQAIVRIAQQDLDDVDQASIMILDTLSPGIGGREFEAGYAYKQGIQVIRVGPIRTPFHALLDIAWHDSWDELVRSLMKELHVFNRNRSV